MIRHTALLVAALAWVPARAVAEEPRPSTVFINYEGGPLSYGTDSALDQIDCISSEIDYPAFFGSEALADQVTEQVRAILAPFAVRVVDERPPSHLPYTMVMVGGLPQALGLDAGVGGYACVIDCGDLRSRDTVLVFAEEVRDPIALAQTIVHEVGHSWGLDHVLASELIMNGTTSGAERMLGDSCTALEDPAGAGCPERHAMFCDEPNTQHAVAELMEVRGPSQPDITPPTVVLLSPRDGAQVVPGQLVRVEVEVEDDRPELGWRFVVPELEWWMRADGATTQELRFPPGEYTVRVEAIDQAGNTAAAAVALVVGEAPAAGDQEEPMDAEPEPEPAGTGADEERAGGCRIAMSGEPASRWLLLGLLLVRRRRSRA